MAVGIYGTIRAADVNINDIDVYYTYAINYDVEPSEFKKLNSTEILSYNYLPTEEQTDGEENLMEGIYNLNLPAYIFNKVGIYSLYIKPKTIKINIADCNVLSTLPNVRGIVIDSTKLPSNLRANNALQGYKIEYINEDGTKLRNVVRYIVSANKVVPVSQNVGNTSQKLIRYKFDDAGTLLFLQITPSSAYNVKPNIQPFIGIPGQKILLSNTFFSPVIVEINMVENTIDTLTNIVAGEEIKDVNNGILTYYDKDRNIIKQFDLFEIKDNVGDVSLYEVKEKRNNIDYNQNFNDITKDV